MSTNLVLTNAKIIDGTGAAWYRGSIQIENGNITSIHREPATVDSDGRIIDVGDQVVCPGFIDLHSHADLEVLRSPGVEPKLRQGITTVVVGQDGFSTAPISGEYSDDFETYLSGLSGRRKTSATWPSVDAYLTAVAKADPALNVATLVGHGTIRINSLGWEAKHPTEEELKEMIADINDALAAGAVGVSTGLEYFPQQLASTEEVRRIAEPLKSYGRPFVAHIRSYSKAMWSAMEELISIGEELGISSHLSHFKLGDTKRGQAQRALELAHAARDRGVDFTADLYPYTPGSTMLLALLPTWAFEGGPKALLERLSDPDKRQRIRNDIEKNTGSWNLPWEDLVLCNIGSQQNEQYLGQSLADIAAERETDPVTVMCDLLVEEELEATLIVDTEGPRSIEDIHKVICDDLVGVGTDGVFGDSPHPRVYGTYPRILGEYVRERSLLNLEEAIRKMTSLPARIMGFDYKGVIRPGMDADLVVFDPAAVRSEATVSEPNQFAKGITHVLVGGRFVVREETRTGACPGGPLLPDDA